MLTAQVNREGILAELHGDLAFEGHFKVSHIDAVIAYMTQKALGDPTCGNTFTVTVWEQGQKVYGLG